MKKRLLSMLLAVAMVVGLTACGGAKTETAPEAATESAEATTESGDTPLVVGYAPFSSKFSPFFSESAYDQDAMAMTQVSLLINDRQGAMIYKGIEGETKNYNGTDYTYNGIADLTVTENEDGTVYYDFKLRDDVKFSDGELLTADDAIFSMYVLCDPTYDGSATLFSQPIQGLEEYRSGIDIRWKLIAAAGDAGYTANDFYTEEQYNNFWNAFNETGEAFAQEIVDYCVAAGLAADSTDVATAAENWAFPGLAADATAADFFKAIAEAYAYDIKAMDAESAGMAFSATVLEKAGAKEMEEAVQTGESAPNISGIQKIDDYNFRVVMTEVAATAIYQLSFQVAPLHYYGSDELFDIENNSFGFPKGDLSSVRAKTTQPMGAGPYKFIKFENGVINYEANENYFLGAPKTKYVNFLETQEADMLNGVVTGTIDITNPDFNKDTVAAIQKENGGETSGDVITVSTVENLGYGYIGINADAMKIGEERDSEASKNLRKAFATILSVYRDVAVDSYYGEIASVINYPISNTSWAAPQSTDEGYKVAFSTDVNGNDIYTSDMDDDARYAAAKEAALGFFEAAGYTVTDGKVTAAPEGKTLDYEILVIGGGVGDHPSFMICTLAKEALAEIGINLIVTDLTAIGDVTDALRAGTCEMFCMAWGATIDPDMYQIYHSEGGSNYNYDIVDEQLDKLIVDARATTDQAVRKIIYKQCLDIILDWAVEVPIYQRKNAIIFSTERVNMETVTPDITTFYTWLQEIQNVELN